MFVPRSQQNLVSTIAFNRWRRIHATWQVFNWGQNVDRVRRCGTSRVAYLASLGRCDPIADEFIWCLSLTRVLKSFNLLPHYAKWVLVKLSGCTACSIVDVYPVHCKCRVLSLSDCRYSLNPPNETRIDWVGCYRIRWTFKLSCVWH